MRFRVTQAICALTLAFGLAAPAAAQQRPSIAIMPSQYYSADPQSAENLTEGLVLQFEQHGYPVAPLDRARTVFQEMGLSLRQPYPDAVAIAFGRRMGTDLVAYPRLLAVGLPIAGIQDESLLHPSAVVHLRVLNVRTGELVYFRQVGHQFAVAPEAVTGDFFLPQPIATAAADDVLDVYFELVAGTRLEYGDPGRGVISLEEDVDRVGVRRPAK